MGENMQLPVILFILMIPLLVWAFITWDNLIKLEHEKFHQQWLNDGKPTGMFWRSSKSRRSYRSGMATQKFMFMWLFKTPEWAESSDDALSLIKRYRTLVLAWNAGILFIWFVLVPWMRSIN
jgi:ferric iron reductase protein FhuF